MVVSSEDEMSVINRLAQLMRVGVPMDQVWKAGMEISHQPTPQRE